MHGLCIYVGNMCMPHLAMFVRFHHKLEMRICQTDGYKSEYKANDDIRDPLESNVRVLF